MFVYIYVCVCDTVNIVTLYLMNSINVLVYGSHFLIDPYLLYIFINKTPTVGPSWSANLRLLLNAYACIEVIFKFFKFLTLIKFESMVKASNHLSKYQRFILPN